MFENFTDAILGGIIIAVATTLNLCFTGRTTAVSGIFYGCVTNESKSVWKWSFINGMLLTGCIIRNRVQPKYFQTQHVFEGGLSLLGFIIGGYFIGLGSKLANGCTIGHIVCGLPRLSKRSIIAVAVFFASAIGMANFRHHYPFFTEGEFITLSDDLDTQLTEMIFLGVFGFAFVFFFCIFIYHKEWKKLKDLFLSTGLGGMFAYGLIISGLIKRSKVLSFLTLSGKFDLSIVYTFGIAVAINIVTFFLIIKKQKVPLLINDDLMIPDSIDITGQLIIGSAIFGMGWGMTGLGLAPALTVSFLYIPHVVIYLVFVALGQLSSRYVESFINNYIVKIKAYGLLEDYEE